MNNIYIEYLTELEYVLREIEHSWWNIWMKKSIDKFNTNKDVSYFLGAFGGCGSFSDVILESEVSEILTTITYSCVKVTEKNENLGIQDILRKEQDRLNSNISYNKNSKIEWNFKEEELKGMKEN